MKNTEYQIDCYQFLHRHIKAGLHLLILPIFCYIQWFYRRTHTFLKEFNE